MGKICEDLIYLICYPEVRLKCSVLIWNPGRKCFVYSKYIK